MMKNEYEDFIRIVVFYFITIVLYPTNYILNLFRSSWSTESDQIVKLFILKHE